MKQAKRNSFSGPVRAILPADTAVLIVDDQVSARMLLRTALNEAGLKRVFQADNGEVAIKTLVYQVQQNDPIRIIICDWNMPQLTGIELLKKIRLAPGGAHIPFIMLTSQADFASVKEALDFGATGYIAKPWAKEQVIEKLNLIWENHLLRHG